MPNSFCRERRFPFSSRVSLPTYSSITRDIDSVGPDSMALNSITDDKQCISQSSEAAAIEHRQCTPLHTIVVSPLVTGDNKEYELRKSPQIDRIKIKTVLNDIGNCLREGLRFTKEVSIVFPPLQSVAGGLLFLVEVFQMYADNKEELCIMQEQFKQFANVVTWHEDPAVPDEALHRLLTFLDVQLTRVRGKLDKGYFRGLISARGIEAHILKMLRAVDRAFRQFQVEFALDMRNMLRRQECHRIVAWITPITFDADHKAALDLFTPRTGQWFFELPCFDEWKRGKHPVLWCYGNLGVGKTILSGQIVHHLEAAFSDQNVAVLFAYCGHHARHDVGTILRALLRQLLHRSACSQRPRFVWKGNYNTPLSLDDVMSAIEAEVAAYRSVFVVVDALDRLDLLVQQKVLQKLRSISGCLRLLFMSRPNIADLFNFQGVAKIEISARRSDLILFVEKHLAEAQPILRDAVNRMTAERFTDIVIRKADGMFLMAHLQLESLNRCHNYQKVAHTLESFQLSTVHDAYAITLARIHCDDRELLFQILSWISFSHGPLTVEDLRYALAASVSHFNKDNLVDRNSILRLCAGLVCVKVMYDLMLGPICICSLTHYTIHDYVRTIRQDLLSPEDMLSVYVSYLTCTTPTPPPYASNGKRLPFFLAAARSIPVILRDVKDTSNDSFMFDSCLIKHLFDAVEDLFITDHDGAHFIHFAAYNDLCHVIRHIISRDPSLVNSRTKDRYTPLTYAVLSGSKKAVETLLITHGVDVNLRDRDGRTPVSYAAELGDEDILKLLLAIDGVLVDSRDEHGRTPLSYAASSASRSAFPILTAILSKDVDVNSRDKNGRTPLSYAASSLSDSAHAIVETLLSMKDIDVHSKDCDDRTALSYAASSESRSMFCVVKTFLCCEGILVSVQSKDKNGRTPLSYAASSGSYSEASVVESLLAVSEFEAYLKDKQGRIPLSYAVTSCSPSALYTVIALLAVEGTDINSRDEHGRTPLSYAASSTSHSAYSIVQALLGTTRVIDVNSKDGAGRTALSYAMSSTSYYASSIIEALLSVKDIDVHSRDRSGRDALSYAASSWSNCISSSIKVLLAIEGIDINSKDECGRSPLSYAASSRSMSADSTIGALLSAEGIDVNSRDNTGRTPLFYAVESTSHYAVSIIKTLLATDNINVILTDHEDRSPFFYAISDHIQQLLLEVAKAQGCVDLGETSFQKLYLGCV